MGAGWCAGIASFCHGRRSAPGSIRRLAPGRSGRSIGGRVSIPSRSSSASTPQVGDSVAKACGGSETRVRVPLGSRTRVATQFLSVRRGADTRWLSLDALRDYGDGVESKGQGRLPLTVGSPRGTTYFEDLSELVGTSTGLGRTASRQATRNESQPIISLRPSTTRSASSSEARARRRPMRSTESVRIWLILTHDRFGKPGALLSSVSGKPARGS